MKNKNKILVLTLSVFLLSAYSSAYNIDGDISDWGVDLAGGLNDDNDFNKDAWVPTGHGTVDWIVEDNIDPTHVGNDWTGYNARGVHIQGTGGSYSDYVEPLMYHPGTGKYYAPPSGGEYYDMEAMYFDDDSQNAYFAIVTSMPSGGISDCDPGDLALDLDLSGGYEYGIVLTNHDGFVQGQICYEPSWSSPGFPDSGPLKITDCGIEKGYADVAYEPTGITDKDSGNTNNAVDNWVIEIKAPKTALGQPQQGDISKLHATITCGNDFIELEKYKWDFSVPEFVSGFVAFLIVLVTPGFAYLISKK